MMNPGKTNHVLPPLNHPSALSEMIEKWLKGEHEATTAIPGLSIFGWEEPTEATCYMFTPHLCLIAQGAKKIVLGNEPYVYNAQSFVVSSVELPIVSQIIEATPDKPYLGLTLELDMNEISELMVYDTQANTLPRKPDRGLGVSKLTAPLLNAIERLLALLDTPSEIPVFLPLLKREIYLRLLMDEEQGDRLKQMAMAKSHSYQIAQSISWMKKNFDKPLQIKKLARHAGMSPSSFHQHFRSLTAISPLQFQKRIRLNEARRLMLTKNMDAGNASFMVGYESPTQFNREYKRMFGFPPLTDIKRLQT